MPNSQFPFKNVFQRETMISCGTKLQIVNTNLSKVTKRHSHLPEIRVNIKNLYKMSFNRELVT